MLRVQLCEHLAEEHQFVIVSHVRCVCLTLERLEVNSSKFQPGHFDLQLNCNAIQLKTQ